MAVLTEVPRAEFLCERHGGDLKRDRKDYGIQGAGRSRKSNGWWMKGVDRIQSSVGSVASEVVGVAGGLTETRLTVARIENGPACQIRPIPSPPGQNPPTQRPPEYLKLHIQNVPCQPSLRRNRPRLQVNMDLPHRHSRNISRCKYG